MKKIVAILLVLAVAAAGVFAEISFGGSATTGVLITTDGDTTVQPFSQDAGLPYRLRLDTSYNDENWGAFFRLQFAHESWRANQPADFVATVTDWHVWFSAFDSQFKVIAGNADADHPLRSPGYQGSFGGTKFYGPQWASLDGDGLFLFQYKPNFLGGLTIAWSLGQRNFGDVHSIGQWFGNEAFGVNYTAGAISVGAGWQLKYDAKDWENDILAWFKYGGSNWQAVADAKFVFGSTFGIVASVGGDLKLINDALYLKAVARFNLTTGDNGGVGITIVPAVKYTINPNNALEVDFNISIGDGAQRAVNKADFTFQVVPSYELKVGGGAALVFYDQITIADGDFSNAAGVDFRWSF
jgi:hypothetical protein